MIFNGATAVAIGILLSLKTAMADITAAEQLIHCISLPSIGSASINCQRNAITFHASKGCTTEGILATVVGGVIEHPSPQSLDLLSSCRQNRSAFQKPASHAQGPKKYFSSASSAREGVHRSNFRVQNPESQQERRIRFANDYSLREFPVLSRAARSLDPALPPGCSYAYNTTTSEKRNASVPIPEVDDDDNVSENTTWPVSMHCSRAGLTVLPTSLPYTLIYVWSVSRTLKNSKTISSRQLYFVPHPWTVFWPHFLAHSHPIR